MDIDFVQRRSKATDDFNGHEKRSDGVQVASSLSGGLTFLRDALYSRVHDEVEMAVGMDSMLMPISALKAEQATKDEIEVYQIVVSASTVAECGYVKNGDWYLRWLTEFRLGSFASDAKINARLQAYLGQKADARRLAFTDVLTKVLPESRRAPLVLYRLHPLAVELATALAFGDVAHATEIRNRQRADLPSIRDCHQCHGKLVDNGEQCPVCGNPLWKYAWLAAD